MGVMQGRDVLGELSHDITPSLPYLHYHKGVSSLVANVVDNRTNLANSADTFREGLAVLHRGLDVAVGAEKRHDFAFTAGIALSRALLVKGELMEVEPHFEEIMYEEARTIPDTGSYRLELVKKIDELGGGIDGVIPSLNMAIQEYDLLLKYSLLMESSYTAIATSPGGDITVPPYANLATDMLDNGIPIEKRAQLLDRALQTFEKEHENTEDQALVSIHGRIQSILRESAQFKADNIVAETEWREKKYRYEVRRLKAASDAHEEYVSRFKLSKRQLQESPFAEFYGVLTGPPDRSPTFNEGVLSKERAKLVTEGLHSLFAIAEHPEADAEFLEGLNHEYGLEQAIKHAWQRATRLKEGLLEPVFVEGMIPKGIWLKDNWSEIVPIITSHVAPDVSRRLAHVEYLLNIRDSYPQPEVATEPVAPITDDIGEIALQNHVQITGKIEWEVLPPEEMSGRTEQENFDEMSKRIRERYPRKHAEPRRIRDFVEVHKLFGGEVWENSVGKPGAVLVFEYDDTKFVLAEWFVREAASYLISYDEDLDWKKLLKLHRRDVRNRGGVQILHPPLDNNGDYAHGDHPVAVLEHVHNLLAKRDRE